MLLLLALSALAAGGGLAPFDRWLTDLRFGSSSLKASGQVALVEIDSKSIAEIGVWPWSRQLHADVLDTLLDLGANQVVFDVDFSSASTPEGDAAFTEALRRAGGFAFLAAFVQATPAGITLSLPAARFLAHAEPVLVNVLLNSQGLSDSFLAGFDTGNRLVPALPIALSGRPAPEQNTVFIDFGIDPQTIDRISFVDVLQHRVDPARIKGKDIIIGASAIELHDFFQVPHYGVISGQLLQALGMETLQQGRVITHFGSWPGLALAALIAILLAFRRRAMGLGLLAAAMIVAILGYEAAATLVYLQRALLLDTALFDLAMPALFLLELGNELSVQIRQRREAQHRLAYLAHHDTITGALSRIGLLDQLSGIGPAGTIILVRLIRLDSVRATLGQDIADATLRLAATNLQPVSAALLAYVREDTFALAFVGPRDEQALTALCNDAEAAIATIREVDGHAVHVAVTLSTATGPNSDNLLLHQAETALIHNGTAAQRTSFDIEQSRAIEFRRRLDIDLRAAIAANALHLVFQPQVALSDGRLVGAEALVRWNHPTLGKVSPAIFIPLAEETGAIVDLGRWVLQEACRQQAAWAWSGRLAVNVSPVQFERSDVIDDVTSALQLAALPANRLDIEITEGALMQDTERARRIVDALSQRGVGVALDDFGTGYSSLNALTTLAFDKIKIDQSFIQRLGLSAADDALLRSIVELCQRQHKQSVTEGVETAEQAAQLKAWGCDIAQGYYFSKPLSAVDFEAFIRSNH
ncbi:MAG: EAL domain-containing protein [Devosia sp.]